MATWIEARTKSFTAGEDLAMYRRVKLGASPTQVVYADAGDFAYVGFTIHAVAAGDEVAVHLGNGAGTFLCQAAGIIAAGASVYPAADGKVAATGGVPAIGTALTAASGVDMFIEVMPWPETATADHETRIGVLEGTAADHETRVTALEAADVLTLTAGEALAANRLVKIASGAAVYADAADGASIVGVTLASAANGAPVSVKRANGAGQFKIEALAAFAAGAALYVVADGKVDDAGTTVIGIAAEAAAAPAEVVDVILTL